MEERPSNAVYIERDGILYGLITSGRIIRSRDDKTRRVSFNKKFTYFHPGELVRVRQIFRDKENINVLPVISEDGRLLGDYVRWDDLIGTDHAELICKDLYVLQCLKEDIQNVVFVESAVRGETNKTVVSLWWRQRLEREGIHFQVIQPREIKDYLNIAKHFLCVDRDEKDGIENLANYLYCNKGTANRSFLTIKDYLYGLRRIADLSFLKDLQRKGVTVLEAVPIG